MIVGLLLGGVLVAACITVVLVRRREASLRRRLERLSAQAKALAAGETPPFEPVAAVGALGELERNIAALTAEQAVRAEQHQVEAARQRLDGQIQRALAMAETEDEALDVTSRALEQAAPGCPAELLLANESESELHLAAVAASGAPGCPVSSPSGCAAMRAGQPLRFSDEHALDICPQLRNRSGGFKPAACIPLAPTRGTMGVLHATSEDGPIAEQHVARLELVATHTGTRLRMLHVLTVFQTQAETDALTGLLNRRSFEQRAATMLRSNRGFVLAIADLDHFKRLNDTHGHATGDQALRVFARTAKTFASDRSGVAARLGGEEFVIVLPLGREAPEASYDELRVALRQATSAGASPSFTVSIGAAVYPTHGTTLGELLGTADRALYQAKSGGRDRVVLYGSFSAEDEVAEKPQLRGVA